MSYSGANSSSARVGVGGFSKPKSFHQTESSTSSAQDGWVLYYSEEGYPYYYNHHTGESQWAEGGDSSWGADNTSASAVASASGSQSNRNTTTSDNRRNNKSKIDKPRATKSLARGKEDNTQSDPPSDSESGSGSGSSDDQNDDDDNSSSSGSTGSRSDGSDDADSDSDSDSEDNLDIENGPKLDGDTEKLFREYLRTPEGITAMQVPIYYAILYSSIFIMIYLLCVCYYDCLVEQTTCTARIGHM